MFYLDQTCTTPEENLAWDEALIELADAAMSGMGTGAQTLDPDLELLRVWQMPTRCVVVGRSSRLAEEVQVDRCRADAIPVLRRMSGGASIVAGPGCLMYSLMLSLNTRPECRQLDKAHQAVMQRTRLALQRALERHGVVGEVDVRGTCDLTLDGRKISGNSLRVKRNGLLYHGTLLIDMPLEWIERYLLDPPKQPDYRARRSHADFVTSLQQSTHESILLVESLKESLQQVWQADRSWLLHPLHDAMPAQVENWMARRYADPAWHAGNVARRSES